MKHTPGDKEDNRAFNKNDLDLTVEFTQPVDIKTVTQSSFKVGYLDMSGKLVAATGSYSLASPETLKFVPTQDLLDGVKYYVTIEAGATGVLSDAGLEMKAKKEYTFWTAPDLQVHQIQGRAKD